MKSLRILFSAAAILWFASSVQSQITITADDFPAAGESMIMQDATAPVTFDPGDPGANMTWTIPDYGWSFPMQIDWVDPAATPFAGQFPTSNRVSRSSVNEDTISGTGYRYERIAQNGYYAIGFAVDTDVTDYVHAFSAEALQAPLPATYGASWTTVERYTIQVLPGYSVTYADSSISTVDAWGSITTPFGTFACLRVFVQSWEKMIPPFPLPMTQSATVSYEWVTNTPAVYFAASFESEEDMTDPNFTTGYMSISRMGIIDSTPIRGPVVNSFSVGQNYPNPFNPTTSLPISLEKAGTVEITIYNELGEVISSETRSFGPGNHTVGFDGSAWASGNYFAQVRADGQLQTKRMTLVK